MPRAADDSIPTRPSLLRRVKNWKDHASWQLFYDTYKRIVRGSALRAGLNEQEADDIVQETFLEVAQKMPGFDYDSSRGSFKAWLLQLTRWRILDHLRKVCRRRKIGSPMPRTEGGSIKDIPDPSDLNLDDVLENEWRENLLQAAISGVRRKADPVRFQMFDLYVNKECPPEQVAAAFGVTVGQVYLTKHRISQMVKAEFKRLEGELS